MGKKQKSKFAESIDPRFTGLFKSSVSCETGATVSNRSGIQSRRKSDSDKGFKDFLSQKLYEFLESNTKEVERSSTKNDLVQFKIEDVQLFSDSNVILQDRVTSSLENIPPKKKRRKERNDEDELLKQVAVTSDFIHKQAQLFNS